MSILLKPIVTEKMTKAGETHNRFGFIVDRAANKIEIKNAVEKQYGVTVLEVNTMQYYGKIKTRNTKSGVLFGRVKRAKKAIVKLKAGDTIDFFASI